MIMAGSSTGGGDDTRQGIAAKPADGLPGWCGPP